MLNREQKRHVVVQTWRLTQWKESTGCLEAEVGWAQWAYTASKSLDTLDTDMPDYDNE